MHHNKPRVWQKWLGIALALMAFWCASSVAATAANTSAHVFHHTISLNGRMVDLPAYLIENNNYIKLRDFAMLLRDTEKSFEVEWKSSYQYTQEGQTHTTRAVLLTSHTPYTPVGGEMSVLRETTDELVLSTGTIFLDGVLSHALKGYMIDQNNYYKLRDLCQALDIAIWYDAPTRTVQIVTSQGSAYGTAIEQQAQQNTQTSTPSDTTQWAVTHTRSIDTPTGELTIHSTAYTLDNQDRVVFSNVRAQGTAQAALVEEISVTDGTLRMYQPQTGWYTVPTLKEGIYQGTMLMYDDLSGSSMMAYLPQSWTYLVNNAREHHSTGFVKVLKAQHGYTLALYAPPMQSGMGSDYTVVQSDHRLVDWSNPDAASFWAQWVNTDRGYWCYDGFYWISPATYVPTGERVYYRMVGTYMVKTFVYAIDAYRLADDLSLTMLDVMAKQQNVYGYFPTPSESTWLSQDYGIAAGFYDTRFNTDLIQTYLKAYTHPGYERYQTVLRRYRDFFLAYAQEHHTTTTRGGWLVEDYYHPSGNQPVHCSLNHQLSEILCLYQLSDALDDPNLIQLADKMVVAIEDCGMSWLQDNGNLHYAIYPDGSYGGVEYPYLTYNDLYALQAELVRRGRGRNSTFDQLMQSKRTWMDANGITEYKK